MWQLVLMINGYFISVLGCAMLAVAGYDMYITQSSWSLFLNAALFTLFVGMSMFLSNRAEIKSVSIRQGFLLTTTSWLSISLLATLPFLLYGCAANFHDAWFEAVSGITCTGATIFADVESLPKPILLWRSVLNMMGGIGVVIFVTALLPLLGIGGMQIFQRENSDINDKFMPKFHYIAKRIIAVYIFLLVCCIVSLYFAGMGWFDAVNHGFSTVATAGFSTKNASIGYFDSPKIETVVIIFMLLSAMPMTFFVMLWQNRLRNSLRLVQVVVFLKVVFVVVLCMCLWLWLSGVYADLWQALRYSAFNVVSVMTTTGFSSANYLLWGSFAVTAFAFIGLIGGCTGSTTGSIKIFRWQVIWSFIKQSMELSVAPRRMVPLKIGQFVLDKAVISSVLSFITLFMSVAIILTLLVALTGVDAFTALAAVMGCITNVGPGVAESIGPSGSFGAFSWQVKDILAVAMLLGRLEILTILVVFTRSFWRN